MTRSEYFSCQKIVAICFGVVTSVAFSNQAEVYSFDLAQKILLEKASEIQQKKQEIIAEKSYLKLAYSAMIPTGSLNWNNQKRDQWSDGYSVDFETTLFSGGAEYSEIASRRLNLESKEQELKDLEDRMIIKLANVMLQGALAIEKKLILVQTLKTIDDRVREQTRRYKLGQVREPDLLQSKMESLRLERNISSLEQQYFESINNFKSMLHLGSEKLVEFSRFSDLVKEISGNINPRSEYLIASLTHQQKAIEYQIKSVWRSRLPTLSGFANYGESSNVSGLVNAGADWTMGLRARWVFFDGFSLPSEVTRAKAQKRMIDEKLNQLILDRSYQVASKRDELRQLEKNLVSVKDSKELAKKSVFIQQQDYRRGIVTELEVLSTIQNYLEVQNEELDLVSRITSVKLSALELGSKL